MPSWANRITRHFWATRCGVVPERTNDSSCALAASSTDRAVAVGNMTQLNHGQLMLSIVMWDGTLERKGRSKLPLSKYSFLGSGKSKKISVSLQPDGEKSPLAGRQEGMRFNTCNPLERTGQPRRTRRGCHL